VKYERRLRHTDLRDKNTANPRRRQLMNSGMRKAGRKLAEQSAASVDAIRELAGDLSDALQAISDGRAPRIDELTMPDVVGFFVDKRKDVPAATAAAILRDGPEGARGGRDSGEDEYLVHLFFLDSEGRPLIRGNQPRRSYLTRRFDGELTRAFGDNNIVIFN
jgi:hypothetical protein